MTPGDFMLIASVQDAEDAGKKLKLEIDAAYAHYLELKKQREALLDLKRRLCKHEHTFIDEVCAGAPRFRKYLRHAHMVICRDCDKWVDDAPVHPLW